MQPQLGITEIRGERVKLMPINNPTYEQIMWLHDNPFSRCIECEGACVIGMAITLISPEVSRVMPIICPSCGGTGLQRYLCYS